MRYRRLKIIAFIFDEIWYELNGVEIDRNRNIGITSTLKNYASMTYDKALIALNAGWNFRSDTEEGYFNFCMLNMLLRGLQTRGHQRSPRIDFVDDLAACRMDLWWHDHAITAQAFPAVWLFREYLIEKNGIFPAFQTLFD